MVFCQWHIEPLAWGLSPSSYINVSNHFASPSGNIT
jgi:hypothetical protein